jgi:hypothetical protein
MKRPVLGFVLAIAAFALLVPPVLAEPGSPSAPPWLSSADQVFLASLAAPALAAQRPVEKVATLCSATVDCLNGTMLSCTSTTSSANCSSVNRNCANNVRGSVTCDGVTSQCPPCFGVGSDCEARQEQCAQTCSPCPIRSFQCSPYVCECVICP